MVKRKKVKKLTFLDTLLSLFGISSDPQKRALRLIARVLRKDKLHFYKVRHLALTPQFARFMYQVYQAVSPVARIVPAGGNSKTLKRSAINTFLPPELADVENMLSDANVKELMDQEKDLNVVKNMLETAVGQFTSAMTKEVRANINILYHQAVRFVRFCHYDFYFLLKRFDGLIVENSFTYVPRFQHKRVHNFLNILGDLADVIFALPVEADLSYLLPLFKTHNDTHLIKASVWRRILHTLMIMQRTALIPNIIRHASGKPNWRAQAMSQRVDIVSPYLEEVQTHLRRVLEKVTKEWKNSQEKEMVKAVFAAEPEYQLENYIASANSMFSKTRITGYAHTTIAHYTTAYYVDFFQKEVMTVVRNNLLDRAVWARETMYHDIMETLKNVTEMCEDILQMDKELAPSRGVGERIQIMLKHVVYSDLQTQHAVIQEVTRINNRVKTAITVVIKGLQKMVKLLEEIIQDTDDKIITNWQALCQESEVNIKVPVLMQRMKNFTALVQGLQK